MDPNAATPRKSDEEQEIEKLIRDDRKNLRSFVDCRNYGLSFDELDEDFRAWWLARY